MADKTPECTKDHTLQTEDLCSLQLYEDALPTSVETSDEVFDYGSESQPMTENTSERTREETVAIKVFYDCGSTQSNDVQGESQFMETLQMGAFENVLPASRQNENTVFDCENESLGMNDVTGECRVLDGFVNRDEGYPTSASLAVCSQNDNEYLNDRQSACTKDEVETWDKRLRRKKRLKIHGKIHNEPQTASM